MHESRKLPDRKIKLIELHTVKIHFKNGIVIRPRNEQANVWLSDRKLGGQYIMLKLERSFTVGFP